MSKLKRLSVSLMVVLAVFLVAVPALAACYAYIYIEESGGNSYDDLPLICPCNITQLAQSGFITSTGLDTRVLTGDGYPLPHMLTNDKILFVTDLEAYEDKTLIFYTGASSLASFPIIVGHDGYITTSDDPDLEQLYVMELLACGYFDSSAGMNKNVLYKQNAFKMNISAADTLRVAALEAGDAEQWEMHYSSFTSGDHTIYIMANGLVAYLYVDDFEVAKDTANLFDSTSYQCINKNITAGYCFYDEGYYWIFYRYDSTNLGYITSADGLSWSGETTIALDGGDSISNWSDFNVKMRDEYVHIVYANDAGDDTLKYRRGDLTSAPGISWSAGWQTAHDSGGSYTLGYPLIAIDSGQYPYIAYEYYPASNDHGGMTKSSANDGTWSTAGGYPFDLWSVGANNGVLKEFMYYPNSDKLLVLWDVHGYDTWWDNTYVKYYNGSSWEPVDDVSSYITDIGHASMAADENDNMYIAWSWGATGTYRLAVRYDGEVWDSVDITSTGCVVGGPRLSFNENTNVLYILYGDYPSYVYCVTLNTEEMELYTPVAIVPLLDAGIWGVNPYEDHIGFLLYQNPNTYHGYVDLTAYQWNDNANNWTWMENNVMPYADDFQMAIDGTLQLEYEPATIIQGTTLPDEESDHDGTITWGSNPSGVDVSHSELMCEEEDEEGTGYYYFEPGSQDIIKPDPMAMTDDVDLEALRDNPLYPLAQILTIDGFLTERLAWLGIAWFITILAMFAVHMGFEHKPNTKRPEHFILTTIAGLGLSILFYTWGIFPLWVIILMSSGLLGAVIWERQPVI